MQGPGSEPRQGDALGVAGVVTACLLCAGHTHHQVRWGSTLGQRVQTAKIPPCLVHCLSTLTPDAAPWVWDAAAPLAGG